MTGTNLSADRMGFLAMMSPVAAIVGYALATVVFAGFPTFGFVLMVSSILVLLLSIPINAALCFRSRRVHRQRAVQALVGVVAGILLSAALFAAMRVVHLKNEAVLQQLRESQAGETAD
jgi:hypothetical protein